jgi:hypothetical protein
VTFDTQVPPRLKMNQLWFGSIISRPIDVRDKINPISPSGRPMELEAADFIRPSPTLQPVERIQIYNQQYWWRLLSAMHDSFPLVTRLFGYHDFNQMIAVPYLMKYPPLHWSLSYIGVHLPQWVEEDYREKDKPLIYDAALIDSLYTQSFIASRKDSIGANNLPRAGEIESLLQHPLVLQDHVHLLSMNYDLFDFRFEFIKKDPDYWIENDFPPLKKEKCYHFVLYRNPNDDISWREVSPGEYQFLQQFKDGNTIENACEWLETQDGPLFEEAMKNMHHWFQEWVLLKWLRIAT